MDALSSGTALSITFKNLSLPTSKYPSSQLILRTIRNNQITDRITYTLPNLVEGTFSNFQITLDYYNSGHPFANYTFKLTLTKQIPLKSKLKFTFPNSAYNFDTSYDPICDNLPFSNLTDESATAKVTCSFAGNTLEITNFKQIEAGSLLTIAAASMTNPSTATSYSIVAESYDENAYLIESGTASVAISSSAFSPVIIPVSKSIAVPDNDDALARYEFVLKPPFMVPKDTEINMYFPGAYGLLFNNGPETIYCVLKDGLSKIRRCELINPPGGKLIKIQTEETSKFGKDIVIEFYGLTRNPSYSMNGFSFSLWYKGLTIAESSFFTVDISQKYSIFYKYSTNHL